MEIASFLTWDSLRALGIKDCLWCSDLDTGGTSLFRDHQAGD